MSSVNAELDIALVFYSLVNLLTQQLEVSSSLLFILCFYIVVILLYLFIKSKCYHPCVQPCKCAAITRLPILLLDEGGAGTSRVRRRRVTGHTGRTGTQGRWLEVKLASQLLKGNYCCDNWETNIIAEPK